MYEYRVPPGVGDTFFQYVFDAQGQGLTDATTRLQLGIPISDGEFRARFWTGITTIADRLQIYDWLSRSFSSGPMLLGPAANGGASDPGFGQMVVLPEVAYPDNGNIRFDLTNIDQDVAGVDGGLTVYASQLVFSGVRRRRDVVSDPLPSAYKYYEKPFSIPYTLSINNYASSGGLLLPGVQFTIPVTDYDFELRRIELGLQEDGQQSQFKILLYDTNWHQVSNLPVLSNLLMHLNPQSSSGNPFASSGELNFWPSPPLLYRVNSVIRFDIFSLLFSPTMLPQTFEMNFVGVRRIPCS